MKANISRLIIGVVLCIVGVALFLNALNIVDTSSVLKSWWPLLLVLGGVVMLISDSKNYLWALVAITVGVFAQLRVLGYYSDISLWQVFWPLALIAVGVSIAMGHSVMPRTRAEEGSDDIVAILGGSDQKNLSDDFTGSKVTAILGGAKIDLRKATITNSATLEVFTLMGGIELVVPRDVVIKNQTNVILGGVENKTDQEVAENSPTLTVAGDVIMGGVEIKN